MSSSTSRLLAVVAALVSLVTVSTVSLAAGGGDVPTPTSAIVIDGVLDAGYEMVDEATYAAPDILGVGQTTSSDALGESSANVVWFDFGDANYLGYDDGSGLFVRNTGTADIQRLYLSWDESYLYVAVEGPNAFSRGDRLLR